VATGFGVIDDKSTIQGGRGIVRFPNGTRFPATFVRVSRPGGRDEVRCYVELYGAVGSFALKDVDVVAHEP